ncbi:hypothetical protein BpHYR1_029980 [Brachionus plicatilis]|uniref:Uncharacterized protein n=1 Tax=Brachionus plicatilis TaxID=10195 RepID=A0A3M7R2V1_BRAPC|nr:hypothetical protein BpHYR1_029980 [Brachionus plicatilis]
MLDLFHRCRWILGFKQRLRIMQSLDNDIKFELPFFSIIYDCDSYSSRNNQTVLVKNLRHEVKVKSGLVLGAS